MYHVSLFEVDEATLKENPDLQPTEVMVLDSDKLDLSGSDFQYISWVDHDALVKVRQRLVQEILYQQEMYNRINEHLENWRKQ